MWRRLVPLLASRFRVIAPDLVLGGDLPAQTAAVRELLTHLGVERFAAIGHSHGGGIAQLLALDGPAVDALVLLDTVAFDVAPPADLDPRTLIEKGTVEFAILPEADLDAYLAAPRPARTGPGRRPRGA